MDSPAIEIMRGFEYPPLILGLVFKPSDFNPFVCGFINEFLVQMSKIRSKLDISKVYFWVMIGEVSFEASCLFFDFIRLFVDSTQISFDNSL